MAFLIMVSISMGPLLVPLAVFVLAELIAGKKEKRC
jgi:hypothetical protein